MSDEKSGEQDQQDQPDAVDEVPPEKKKPGRVTALAIILSLIALAASGTGLYFLYQLQQQAVSRGAAAGRLSKQLDSLEQTIAAIKGRNTQTENALEKLKTRQEALRDSLNKLYRDQERDSTDWAVAEVEHLMIIATQSLTLQKDVGTSLAALEAADNRLRDLGDPALLPVRRQLTSDINALRAVNDVDISGLSLYLSDLVGRVGELPLNEAAVGNTGAREDREETSAEARMPAWKRFLVGVWHELKSLLVITRSGKAGTALLLPEEKYFLYQNLRLQLETTRAAIFRRDTANFHSSLDIVLQWLRDYFDTGNTAVRNTIQSLQEMKKLNLDQELPDISSSLESLRAYIKEKSESHAPAAQDEPSS
jgi:uroporphyrin-3 C-methyltransferase